jgi:hypothetical protein
LAQKLIAPKCKQKVLNFRKIYTPRFLGCYNAYNSHISGCVITWITCGDVWVSGITHRNLLEIFSTVAHNLYM